VNTENEKAVRDHMREAFEARFPQHETVLFSEIYNRYYTEDGSKETSVWMSNARWEGYQAALQSQVSNTPQDGWKALPVRNIEAAFHPCEFQVTVGFKSCRAASEFMAALEAPPQQQEQSVEAVQVCPECDIAGCRHIRERATPTATASQESAPEAGGEARPVAYRAWLDDERGGRWVFTLWPGEEHLEVIWEPLFLAPPTSPSFNRLSGRGER
jgi:hypothetical protein